VLNATLACRLSHTTWRWRRSDDVALLEGFCVFAAIAIANARLHTGAAAEPEQLARA
jgi:GAF domain-containing protein